MSNDYFTKGGVPGTSSAGSSAVIRGEYAAIEAAFDKLPALSGNGNKIVMVNAGGTGLTSSATLPAGTKLPTLTGDLLFTDATYDIGKTEATRPRDGFFSRNVEIGGTFSLTGNVVSDLKFTDATYDIGKTGATRPRDLFLSRNAVVGGTLNITGQTTLGAQVNLNAGLVGNSSADITINTNKFTVAASTGNTVIAGTLSVGGVSTVAGASGSSLVLIQTQTVGAVSTIDFSTGIDSTYDEYLFVFTAVVPNTNDDKPSIRYSTDGGSSYNTTAGNYASGGTISKADATNPADGYNGSVGYGVISYLQGNNVVRGGICGELRLYRPSSAVGWKHWKALFTGATSALPWTADFGGSFMTTTAVNAIRFLFVTGTITSGTIALYGVRKS